MPITLSTEEHNGIIKLSNAARSEGVTPNDNARGIIRGDLELRSLGGLFIPTYHRGPLGGSKQEEIMETLATIGVPDVIYGLRQGGRVKQTAPGLFELMGELPIIDGLQRTLAALRLLKEGSVPLLGAAIYLGTDPNLEYKMFRTLNLMQTKLSGH